MQCLTLARNIAILNAFIFEQFWGVSGLFVTVVLFLTRFFLSSNFSSASLCFLFCWKLLLRLLCLALLPLSPIALFCDFFILLCYPLFVPRGTSFSSPLLKRSTWNTSAQFILPLPCSTWNISFRLFLFLSVPRGTIPSRMLEQRLMNVLRQVCER